MAATDSKMSVANNSIWGLGASLFQTFFLTVFFIIISRSYDPSELGDFFIANNIYQLIIGFSSMGLGHAFIRSYHSVSEEQRVSAGKTFIKSQLFLGFIFYVLNIIIVFAIYSDSAIRTLSILIGLNVIFDNFIYGIKNINIAEGRQKFNAVLLGLDGFFRLVISCFLLIFPYSVTMLALLCVLVRLATVGIFLRWGMAWNLGVRDILFQKIPVRVFKEQVLDNWRFVVIASISIIFWRSGIVMISKFMDSEAVSMYEVASKVFSIFMLVPLVLSASVYPKFSKLAAGNAIEDLKTSFRISSRIYLAFSITSFVFLKCFGGQIITYLFGNMYFEAIVCLDIMAYTILVFPTALLQANLIVAMKFEKVDMRFNIAALFMHLSISLIWLSLSKGLHVINVSIFLSFLLFHFLQSLFLYNKGIVRFSYSLSSYGIICLAALFIHGLLVWFSPLYVFLIFSIIASLFAIYNFDRWRPLISVNFR